MCGVHVNTNAKQHKGLQPRWEPFHHIGCSYAPKAPGVVVVVGDLILYWLVDAEEFFFPPLQQISVFRCEQSWHSRQRAEIVSRQAWQSGSFQQLVWFHIITDFLPAHHLFTPTDSLASAPMSCSHWGGKPACETALFWCFCFSVETEKFPFV